MAISVNILRLRVTNERQPRTKNGQPAQRTTGVANANWMRFDIWRQPNAEVDQMAAHLQDEDRQRQHEADPEPARHVEQFEIVRRFGRDRDRLQRHAADRA